jgi:2-oxoglutarate dehydrogenase E1 component
VNGDDPEAVVFVTQMAVDYRNQFNKDVVIDLVCYRRRGHNEADEPSVTQPGMYERIKSHASTRTLYAKRLIEAGLLTEQQDAEWVEHYREALERDEPLVSSLVSEPNKALFVDWSPYLGHRWDVAAETGVPLAELKLLSERVNQVPEGVAVHRVVKKLLADRLKMGAGAQEVNWGFAETMAYASLLDAGYPVRLTGQDVGRGTFSHRHAVLHNQRSGEAYVPLMHLSDAQAPFRIFDSLLSEEAVLAFEYGYATTSPDGLVVWEAQFGDFANGAQVVIDQFISSGENKWSRLCGLTMLLPHGYEGQGPEHSSARLERFLQLCAEDNIQVCIPSTPAQVFHMLRRQAVRPLRTPLVVMTPKSLLRHKEAVSQLEELAEGAFQTVIDETDAIDPQAVKRVVLCSGKVFYDLRAARRERELDDIVIIRIEQMYPFPRLDLQAVLERYPNFEDAVWVQEEPKNQGSWYAMQSRLATVVQRQKVDVYLRYVGREPSASAAAGYSALHLHEQQTFIDEALGPMPWGF